MHHPTDRIAHTPVMEHWLEREIAQWVHTMEDRSDDPSHHERMLSPRSYISLPPVYKATNCCIMNFMSWMKEVVHTRTCAYTRHVLQQLAMNMHVNQMSVSPS